MVTDNMAQKVIDVVESYGGMFSIEQVQSIEPNVQAFFQVMPKYLKEMIVAGYEFDVTFIYIDNDTINALAAPYAGQDYFIGIFSGVIPRIYDICYRLMANPDVLPNVGDISKESIDNLKAPILQCHPRDGIREAHAACLCFHATIFILAHEWGHIFGGHLDFLQQETGSSLYLEADESRPERLSPIIAQGLECDADMIATEGTLLGVVAKATGNVDYDFSASPYNSPSGVFFLWSLAISILFQLMDSNMKYQKTISPDKRSHPHPYIRERLIKSRAIVRAEKRIPEHLDAIAEAIQAGYDMAHSLQAYTKVKYRPLDFRKEWHETQKAIELLDKQLTPLLKRK